MNSVIYRNRKYHNGNSFFVIYFIIACFIGLLRHLQLFSSCYNVRRLKKVSYGHYRILKIPGVRVGQGLTNRCRFLKRTHGYPEFRLRENLADSDMNNFQTSQFCFALRDHILLPEPDQEVPAVGGICSKTRNAKRFSFLLYVIMRPFRRASRYRIKLLDLDVYYTNIVRGICLFITGSLLCTRTASPRRRIGKRSP